MFAAELPGLDRDEIRAWYDGYNWRGRESVYNPFDILLLFDRREFKAHWFETGTPSFLVDILCSRRVGSPSLEEMVGTDELLSKFDVDDIATEALLFQTGYLTIAEERNLGGKTVYRLDYPNREVKQSLNEHLLRAMGPDPSRQGAHDIRLYELLMANDFAGLEALFRAFFAGIPYNWHVRNDIANFEGYYASVFYSWFAALGLDVTAEDAGSRGRLDMALRFNGNVYLFEFKVVESAPSGGAMAQLKDRRYADKYPRPGRTHPPDSGRIQPQGAQPGFVRGGARMSRDSRRPPRHRSGSSRAATRVTPRSARPAALSPQAIRERRWTCRSRSPDNRAGSFVYHVTQRTEVERDSRKLIRLLERDGWIRVAVRGSHWQFKHAGRAGRITVPHPNRSVKRGAVASIYRQAGWTQRKG